MTREEAMAYAISKKAGIESEINKSNCEYGKWVMYSAALDFINAAISALKGPTREQVEKVWRGEWINLPYTEVYKNKCNRCGNGSDLETNFCPYCGAPMTDEAVDMVMERLEALYGQENT